jgi:hypothetical protein
VAFKQYTEDWDATPLVENIEEAGRLADIVAAELPDLTTVQRQRLLEIGDEHRRLHTLLDILTPALTDELRANWKRRQGLRERLVKLQDPEAGEFHFDRSDVVAVWVSTVGAAAIAADYLDDVYGHEGPISLFAADFRLGFYDQDNLETSGISREPLSIAKLLAGMPYSSSFGAAVIQTAAAAGIANAHSVVLLYNTQYQAERSGVEASAGYRFLGTFDFDENAPELGV